MRTFKTIVIAITMLVAGTTIASAHEGPHGGQVVQASGGFHAELLVKDGKMSVYLLDAKGKSMSNKAVTGKITLQFADSATADLTAKGDDGFWVNNDKAASFTSCVVTFKVGDKTSIAKFEAEKKEKKEEHKHGEGEKPHHH